MCRFGNHLSFQPLAQVGLKGYRGLTRLVLIPATYFLTTIIPLGWGLTLGPLFTPKSFFLKPTSLGWKVGYLRGFLTFSYSWELFPRFKQAFTRIKWPTFPGRFYLAPLLASSSTYFLS